MTSKSLTTSEVATLEWWTVREVANLLRYDASTVRRWCETGKIDAGRMPGGTWRIHKSAVEKMQAGGLPEKRQRDARHVATEFDTARDYFDEEPPKPKARVRT